ncbi:MAG TPA: orotate phosphoribosyltransferase [Chthoniobacterales bacterium]|nr:orotate phosphoribosyltransferase [Chthoniobacterales bacterium]
MSANFSREFIQFAVAQKVLCFGEFKTKAGRLSPYFFDAGLFYDGHSLQRLAQFYAQAIVAAEVEFDMLFGPAYKGIPLVAAVAIALANEGRNVRYSFNRKEEKDHGEGGSVIGAPLEGRVLIVDDVISAGTSVRQSVNVISASRAIPCGVVIALDRMERGTGELSAAQEVEQQYRMPTLSIATLDDLIAYLQTDNTMISNLTAVDNYREKYGVAAHA